MSKLLVEVMVRMTRQLRDDTFKAIEKRGFTTFSEYIRYLIRKDVEGLEL